MSCEWCENITDDSHHIYWLDTEFNEIPKEEDIAFYLATGDHYYDVHIKYCPNCGEKLEWKE